MTELTVKVLPRPRATTTLVATGLNPSRAHAAMACALGSNADISAAAHLSRGITLFRVAGFAPSVASRCAVLPSLLRDHCTLSTLDEAEADALWVEAGTGSELTGEVLWCLQLPPAHAPDVIARLEPLAGQWSMDWGGGRVWFAHDGVDGQVREVAIAAHGEATLVRAPAGLRARVPALHPRLRGVAMLEARVRGAFDPFGVFETGRFLGEGHADKVPG